MSCNSCWPWCKSPPPPPQPVIRPALKYIESKSVIRPTTPPIPATNPTAHKRILSTMFIKDGKVIISYQDMTEEEANTKFVKSTDKASAISTVRFSPSSPSSPTLLS